MKKPIRSFNMLKLIFFMFVFSCCLHAEEQTFIREYTYLSGENDSKITCRKYASDECKRALQEEVGIYLRSSSTIKNCVLTKDEISTLSVAISKFKRLNEDWDGKSYWLKAEIKVDPDDVLKQIDRLRANDENRLKQIPTIKPQHHATGWVVLGSLVAGAAAAIIVVSKQNEVHINTTEVSFQ